mmetsp:Transcript_15099/g.23391  ORF Transcript_15099/g.23391 Transcript_15099/m.23391 type:complete len:460 (+) Transcript_15099:78-1457(+)
MILNAPISIPPSGDAAPPQAQTDFPLGTADIAVFWDFENVRIPNWCPATAASECIRNKVSKYGRIVEKRLYYDSRQPAERSAPRSDLDLSGFTLVDCPSRGRKETLDKKLIVDVLCFAWERASMGAKACVVLITSDGDYSYALARLRDIGVFTIIIYRPDIVAKVLIDNANVVYSWEYDVLGGPPTSQDDEDSYEPARDGNDSYSYGCGECDEGHAVDGLDEFGDSSALTSTDAQPPSPYVQGKFALFCSVVLNAQHRNIKEGISVYSSWAGEANVAAIFYEKIGEKDRDAYHEIRSLAFDKGFIEWGRRNLIVPGKPVIKVKDRDVRREELSPESYVRLSHAGVVVVKPGITSKESDWISVTSKKRTALRKDNDDESAPSFSHNGQLFVGGLAWETTEDSLRSYFRQFGPIRHVAVKGGRGFAFVRFRNPIDAETALLRGQHLVDDKSIDVKPYTKHN